MSSMIWVTALASRLLSETDDVALASRLGAALQVGGTEGATAYLELCRLIGEAAVPVDALAALTDIDLQALTPDAVVAVGQLVVHCFASIRIDYPAQPDASKARSEVSARAQKAYPVIGDALGHDALDFVVRLVGQTVVELSRIAANRAPLVRVETGISLPSSVIAWDLYADPTRGAELMGRNKTGTPMLMPVVVEALAR